MSSGAFSGAIDGRTGLYVTAGLGCSSADFGAMQPGQVAVVERGDCGFYEKALAAQQAGALGCVIYNSAAEPGVLSGTLGDTVPFPVFSPSFRCISVSFLDLPLHCQGTVITIPVFGFSNEAGARALILRVARLPPYGRSSRSCG